MNKRRVVTAIIVCLLSLSEVPPAGALAHSWKLAATGANRARSYVDTATWTYNEDNPAIITYWQKSTGLSDRISGKTYTSTIGKNQIDCSDNTIAYGLTTFYDSRGRSIYTDKTWSDWEELVPDSMGEGIRDFVCAEWDSIQ